MDENTDAPTIDPPPAPDPEAFARLVEENDTEAALACLDAEDSAETARLLDRLSDDQRERFLTALDPATGARVLDALPHPQAISAIEQVRPETAAGILAQLPSDRSADILLALDDEDAAAILERLAPIDAAGLRRLVAYDDDVAGGLMVTEFLAFRADRTVAALLADLDANRDRYHDFDIQYMYVVDSSNRLVGVLRLRDLLLADRHQRLADLMIADPISVPDAEPLEDLRAIFQRRAFIGLPVVDDAGRLVGVVKRGAIELATNEEAVDAYRQSQGIVGGEELRSMPLLLRSRRRLAWLSVNIGLNVLAASIIAMHQDTLEQVIALAVFLPIISDMSGCSGSQAVAVTMRELTLGILRPHEIARVLLKEVSVGIINGLALGALIGVVAWLWKGNPYLGLVVGSALMLNTVVAVAIGGCVPLALKSLKLDPALASGPILTTVTDMCGFFLVLTFAASAMAYLA